LIFKFYCLENGIHGWR